MINQTMLGYGQVRSAIRDLFEFGMKRKAEIGSENVFDFSIGNPSVPAPAQIDEAIKRLLQNMSSVELHSYTTASGLLSLRQALASDLNRRFNANVDASNFYVTCGAAAALVLMLSVLTTSATDEVIVQAPYFAEYGVFIKTAGAKMVIAAPASDLQINLEALEASINANTRAIIINNPVNPSGVVYTPKVIVALTDLLRQKSVEFGHPIYLLSDEPYREIVYGDVVVPWLPQYYEHTLVGYSFSKMFSLPGERIGYVLVPPSCPNHALIMAAIAGAGRAHGYVCAPSLMQRVISECVEVKPDFAPYQKNRNLLFSSLTQMGYDVVRPDGAFYLFIKSPIASSIEFSKLAMKYNLLLVPADSFGAPGYLRASYCVDYDMIVRSLSAFEKVLAECKRAV